ncbi:YaaA family protein [Corynebacterium heidelbergense]|nr:peroxide stress protein YaaA [Corynebacterium heidelbergense]
MLIILPPSETKAPGGTGGPLNFDELSFPLLTPTRVRVVEALRRLCSGADHAEALRLLGLRETQREELRHNAELQDSPTLPAVERYTGVAYDALDANGTRTGQPLPAAARSRLAIGSALFGVVGARDPIPYYRLSGSAKLLPEQGGKPATLRSFWAGGQAGPSIAAAVARWQGGVHKNHNAVIDLRSGAYANLGRIPGAVSVRVEAEYPDGERKVVSHFNKHYKGLLARALALAPEDLGAESASRPGAGANLAEGLADLVQRLDFGKDATYRALPTASDTVTLIVPARR